MPVGVDDPDSELAVFQRCVQNCETGLRELTKMQQKHAEVSRLTFARNIARCEKIHGQVPNYEHLIDLQLEDGQINAAELAHCITHNTDKIDRRFFGYYSG